MWTICSSRLPCIARGGSGRGASRSRGCAAGTGGAPPLLSSRLAHDGAMEEAVIRFAHGDDAGAEAILLQALASDTPPGTDAENDAAAERDDNRWRTLFDLYRATGDAAKFAAARMRYAQRMKRMGPDWVSLEELARSVKAVTASEDAEQGGDGGALADWNSPARLARDGLMSLTRALSQAGSVWTLDWRSLTAIEARSGRALARAADPLGRFAGQAALHRHRAAAGRAGRGGAQQRARHRRRLVAAAPCRAARDAPARRLRAGGAQLLHHLRGVAAFLAGPEGECTALAAPPVSRPSSVWSLLSSAESESFPTHDTGFAALAGDLRGESLSSWQRLDTDLRHTTAPVISCAALLRMDLAAAGTLLSWVRARDANGERVQFVDAHRLIAALFGLVGIADHATVAVRKN
jgi:ABC-type transporter Mla MlaB component